MNYRILSTDWSLYDNRKNVCIQCKCVNEYKTNFPEAYEISLNNNELDYFFSKKEIREKIRFGKIIIIVYVQQNYVSLNQNI